MSARARRPYAQFTLRITFTALGIASFCLTNPNREHPIEIFPTFRQRYYAIITKSEVDWSNHKDFEFFTKDTIRYYQHFPGYLFSLLVRNRDRSKKELQYYLIQTWSTFAAFKVAFLGPYREELTRAAKANTPYIPQVMKIVADDYEYVSPPTKVEDMRRPTAQAFEEIKIPRLPR